MTAPAFIPTSELIQQATDIVIRLNAASVSLLQRHFRLGYEAGHSVADALEQGGIIAPPGQDGFCALTPYARSLRQAYEEPTARELFEAWACDPFEGGDGGDVGSPAAPSTWLVDNIVANRQVFVSVCSFTESCQSPKHIDRQQSVRSGPS